MSGTTLPSSPTRGRNPLQVTRSITERLPGTSGRHGHTHSSHHHHEHHHLTRHIPTSLHRRDRSRDGRNGGGSATATPPQSAAVAAAQVAPRASLEAPRHHEGSMAHGSLSPDLSRRGSLLVAGGGEAPVSAVGGPSSLSKDEELNRESVRAEARTAGLKKSLLDLAAFSTTTNRRLDDTYYLVLQKLTALQNTILALRDLAQASATTNAGFIAESHDVLSEAQAQLDALGDFSAQQERVEALQARVQGGRERIAALGGRVDAVRRRVERWERADREWQERTRRRLKIIWAVVMGAGCVLLVLYWGARIYAPGAGAGEVARGIGEGLGRAGLGGGGRTGDGGDGDGGNGSAPVLDLGRDGGAAKPGDDVLRALDEL